ncbi:MAG: hypothetical protein FWH57_06135 [Oscillospiraceae bacterium]|nr:hypothetical protein [Oscillospiraceae bacterium]
MGIDTERIISRQLSSNETMLWCGKPNSSFCRGKLDLVVFVFSIIWIGFCVFFLVGASIRSGLLGIVTSIPFYLVGIYTFRKGFAIKYINKREMIYAITNERILITRVKAEGRIKNTTSAKIRIITDDNMFCNKKGIGSIRFSSGSTVQGSKYWAFENIDSCEKVLDIYRKAKSNETNAEEFPHLIPQVDKQQSTTLDLFREKRREQKSTKAKGITRKKVAVGVLKPLLFLIIFGLICYGVFSISIVSKTPATVEQVVEVLTSFGYAPKDNTKNYIAQNPSAAESLRQCIVIEKGDIHFEFYSFNNGNSAVDCYASAHSYIYQTSMSPFTEGDWKSANYCKYTLKSSSSYYVAMYVGSTSVFAYSYVENANAINEIMKAIGY